MTKLLMTWLAAVFFLARAALAQDAAYIQIEAQPDLGVAEQRVRDYAATLEDVNGFSLGAGWYGIALGPYEREDAQRYMRELRAAGSIPRDSYVAAPSEYQSQFWPVGAQLPDFSTPAQETPQVELGAALPETTEPAETNEVTVAEAAPAPQPAPEPEPEPEETLREAQRSEARLTRDEKKELQVALQWAGFYTAAIDGSYGRGTRASMSDWQAANGHETTGVLTTRQRAQLIAQYNSVLDGMGLRTVSEPRAGISMQLPMGVVAFDKYESPFVHYTPTTDLGARVLLISQPGDQNTLFGLYEIMQTLEIVPLEGERSRNRDSFTLTGANDRIVSYTQASLSGGAIKGFTLIWPAGDEERRTRVLDEMIASFDTTSGVLDPAAITDEGQTVDLVSGLQIRRPTLSRSGFYVSSSGSVVTALEAVQNCGRITLDEQYEATIAAKDEALGIAVLRPASTLVPLSVATFSDGLPRLQSEVAIAGYSYEGALGAPTLTFGTLADLRGLNGEADLKRLALSALPGDAGGPVFDGSGAVVGVLLPKTQAGGRVLPEDVSFAAKTEALRRVMSQAGVTAQTARSSGVMAPEDLTSLAADITVLVSCWE
jgi:S1-C subfamily serine protease/peptidoglycan hydrolase-like protein with peptidoglycan-binding domain